MKLRFTPRAIENIDAVSNYLHARNPTAAEHVRGVIYDSLQSIVQFPLLGRRQVTEGVRKAITKKFSYLIYYTVDETADEIVVLNVKHPAQEREFTDL